MAPFGDKQLIFQNTHFFTSMPMGRRVVDIEATQLIYPQFCEVKISNKKNIHWKPTKNQKKIHWKTRVFFFAPKISNLQIFTLNKQQKPMKIPIKNPWVSYHQNGG